MARIRVTPLNVALAALAIFVGARLVARSQLAGLFEPEQDDEPPDEGQEPGTAAGAGAGATNVAG